MKNLFIIIVRYIVEASDIENHLDDHIRFLDDNYKNGTFIASGPQIPKTGGIIIARSDSRSALNAILANDPFAVRHLGEYQVYEFTPMFHIPEFKLMLDSLKM